MWPDSRVLTVVERPGFDQGSLRGIRLKGVAFRTRHASSLVFQGSLETCGEFSSGTRSRLHALLSELRFALARESRYKNMLRCGRLSSFWDRDITFPSGVETSAVSQNRMFASRLRMVCSVGSRNPLGTLCVLHCSNLHMAQCSFPLHNLTLCVSDRSRQRCTIEIFSSQIFWKD